MDPVRVLQKQIVVPASVSSVWTSWTTTEGMTSFLSEGAKIEPWVGGAYEIYFSLAAEPGAQGSDGCKVLAIEPEKAISFSWNAPPEFPTLRHQHTLVRVTLTPKGPNETQVELMQAGWGEGSEWDRLYKYFDDAWGYVLGALKNRFAKAPVSWPANPKARPKQQFIYVIRPARATFPGDATPAETAIVGEHFDYLKGLLSKGVLVLAGRTKDEKPMGFAVFESQDMEHARKIMEADPAVKAGIFLAELHPYSVALSR
jgi:uncharacterized protein YndB with AHSA1/START domain/uncharacterized protein YciI